MMRIRPAMAASIAVLLLATAACSSSSPSNASKGTVVVGNAGFTESEVLSNMYAQVLDHLGYSTSIISVASSEIFQSSLQSGQISVVPEYAATYADQLDAIVNNKSAGNVGSPDLATTMAAIQPLATKLGLTVLTPSSAVDQNAYAVSKTYAAQHHLVTLTDLGKSGQVVTIAGPPECATRPYCQPGLEKVYGIKVKGIDRLGFDTIQGKKAVQDGTDQLAVVSTTDATVGDFDLVVLTDDQHLQNSDNLVPVFNTKALKPDMQTALNKLSATLTTEELGQLNKQVDIDRMTPAAVAKAYLTSKGLI